MLSINAGKLGNAKIQIKISADGMFAKLEEMRSQKMIRLNELPLVGKIHGAYQSIGTKSQALVPSSRKHGRPHSGGGKKKHRVSFDELDVSKDLLKVELPCVHHHIKKTGNKPELIKHIGTYASLCNDCVFGLV